MKRVVIAVSLALVFGLAVSLFGLGVTPAYAQVSKGSISGSVTDPQGAVVAGASVSAVSKDTNQSTTTESDNSVAGPGLFVSDVEFVGEYQITTNNFGPEYGRNSGSVVNIIIKSGTNNVHGAVYGTESNSVLNALSNVQKASADAGFQGLKKPARFNDEFTGGTIGGPTERQERESTGDSCQGSW